jgi:hypothetical protein
VTDEPGSGISDLSLGEVLTEAAAGLAGVRVGRPESAHPVVPSATWAAGPTVFATLVGDRAEFRLDPRVAAAALRTPDTEPSPRGTDWIAFAPTVVDDHAVDRAEAWFLSAYRRASTSRDR